MPDNNYADDRRLNLLELIALTVLFPFVIVFPIICIIKGDKLPLLNNVINDNDVLINNFDLYKSIQSIDNYLYNTLPYFIRVYIPVRHIFGYFDIFDTIYSKLSSDVLEKLYINYKDEISDHEIIRCLVNSASPRLAKFVETHNISSSFLSKYEVSDKGGYFVPSSNTIKGTYIIIKGSDYNNAFFYDSAVSSFLVEQGYEVILFNGEFDRTIPAHLFKKFGHKPITPIKGLIIYAHGSSYNKVHEISYNLYNIETLDLLKKFKYAFNDIIDKKFEFALMSCHSGAVQSYQVQNIIPQTDIFFTSTAGDYSCYGSATKMRFSEDSSFYKIGSDITPLEFIKCYHSFYSYIFPGKFETNLLEIYNISLGKECMNIIVALSSSNNKNLVPTFTIQGNPALIWAIKNNLKFAEELLLNGIDANQSTITGDCPFIQAIETSDTNALILLKKYNSSVNLCTINGWNLIGSLLFQEKFEEFKTLITSLDDFKDEEILGFTPLTWLIEKQALTYVEFILKKGANPNQIDKRGQTPLSVAISKVDDASIELLLKNKARLDGVKPLSLNKSDIDLLLAFGKHQLIRVAIDNGFSDFSNSQATELFNKGIISDQEYKHFIESSNIIDLNNTHNSQTCCHDEAHQELYEPLANDIYLLGEA